MQGQVRPQFIAICYVNFSEVKQAKVLIKTPACLFELSDRGVAGTWECLYS